MTPGSLTMTALGARRRGARLVAVVVTLLFCLVWLVLGGSRRACADSYVSEDGNWTYELDADGNATITDYLGFDSTVVIPPDYESGTIDGHPVVAVGDDALFDDKTVEELWLYDPVVSLGGMAFYGCSSLKEVYFNCDGLTEIPAYCFYGCSSLESISIPGNVKHIGNGAFEGCASLSDVSFLVGSESKGLTIDARAFAGCTRLESITLPSTLDTLSDDVFNGCTSLGAVTFLGIPSSLGASVFSGCSALHSVYIPSGFSFVPDIEAPAGTAFLFFSYDNSGFAEIENTYDNDVAQAHIPSTIGSHEVRSIGGMAFANCTRLTSVVFPDDCNVQTIGEQAFYNCSSLTSITLPESVTSIGMECFSICTSLEQVTFLGDQLTILQTGAFSHCNALKEFDVPNGVTTILNACFYKCLGLTTIRLPDSIVELGTGALGGCAALTDIYMPDTDRELTLFENSFQGTPADQLTFHVRWGSSSWDWLRGDHPRMTDSTVVFDPVPLDDETVEVEVVDSPLYQYCMTHINPIIKVKRFGHQLSPHQQYTFSSTGNNINAGDASVEIVGEGLFTDGSFCGSRTISFTIKPAPLSDDTTMELVPVVPIAWDNERWLPGNGEEWQPKCSFRHEFLPERVYNFSSDEYTLTYGKNRDAGENAGVVTMHMKEGGNFSGTKSFTFDIAKRDLRNDGTIAGLNDYYPYTGEPVTPVPKVSVPDRTGKNPVSLEEKWGDFTISYANNVGWGTATLIIDTTGSETLLEDKIEVPFEIRYPLKDDITIADIPDQTYTGEPITPKVSVSAFGYEMPESSYEVIALAGENVDVGTGNAVVRGRQAEWVASKEFNIVPRRVTVTADDASKPYGAPDPELTATVGNAVPAQEVAYTLSREAGEEVGTYAITATGDEDQGNYLVSFGEAGTFTIERAKLDELVSVADVPDQVYRAEAIEPALSLTRTDTGAALEEGVDYEVSFKDNVEVGTASYTIKGIGNYQGELDGTFSIVALDVSDAQFSVPFQRYVEGERSEPHPEEVSVTLPDGGALVLSEGTHYSVSWERNDAPGTAMLTVTGIGSCTGSRTVPFEIRKLADLSYAQVAPIPDQVYDGQCPHPPLWVTLDDGLLIEGVDYEYDCYDSRVGTATAYLRGLGALEGTELQATFQIVPRDIADGEVEELGPQEWWGNYPRDIWPHLTVDGRDLAAWVEYTCTFENNVEVGSVATVTLHGCGNYTGTTSTTFPIVAYQAIVLPDDASKEYGRGDPELTASLKWGLYGDDKVDYTLEREPGEDVGTYAITVTGERYQCDGHYELVTDATATFTITPADLGEARVTAPSCTYDGTEQRSAPEVSLGGVMLEEGRDFEVTGYVDNVDAGTATVSVRGIGNYVGTATGDFEIVPRVATVTPVSLSKTYGADDPELTATVSGLVGGDEVTYALSRAAGEDAGTYEVSVSAEKHQGNYTVLSEAGTFAITPASIVGATVIASDQTYDGGSHEPLPVLTLGGVELEPGKDFEVTGYGNNVDAGTATVRVRGVGNYGGEAAGTFAIKPHDLSGSGCEVSVGMQLWTGSPLEPVPLVKVPGRGGTALTLEVGRDFVVTGYEDNISGPVGTVRIEGKGNYTGANESSFNIVSDSNLELGYVEPIPDQAYTGGAIEPKVKVGLRGVDLLIREGVDYEVAYADNVEVGTAEVTIRGLGPISGELKTTFRIVAADLSGALVIADGRTYDGTAQEPAPVVTLGGQQIPASDYDTSYVGNVNAGEATVIVTARGANVTGSASGTFAIAPRPAAVTADDLSKTYGADDPELTATVSGLVGGDEVTYTLSREQGEDVGTYVIAAAGKADQGNYAVSFADGTLSILPADLSEASVTAEELTYSGSPLTPEPTVTLGTTELVAGKDFKVAGYEDNVDAGPATVIVEGMGNYEGTASGTFVVAPKPLEGLTPDPIDAVEYKGSPHTPDVTVRDGDAALALGRDYGLSYGNNLRTGTARVDIVGRGNYSGTLTSTFQIERRPVTVAVRDCSKVYGTEDPNFFDADVTGVLDEYLVLYNVTREAGEDVGTYALSATGESEQGDYAVSFEGATLVITPQSLASAQVTVAGSTYDGAAHTPEPTVMLGGQQLVRGRDYDVAYLNNRNAGTATALVRGLGNYVGSARGDFQIAKAALMAAYAGETVAWDESPRLAIEVTGFVGGEDESSAAGYEAPVVVLPSSLDPGASYELAPSEGAALDYTFSYVAGTLSVGLRPVSEDPVAVESLVYIGSEQVGVAERQGFSVQGGSVTDAGTYTAVATLDEGWSWTDGSTDPRTIAWSIAPAAISAATPEAIPDQTHTGEPCEPPILLTFGDAVLVEGKDYEVSYADNVDLGTARALVTGRGNFEGSLEVPFAIVEASYALVSGPSGAVEQGSAATFTFERVGDERATFGHFVGAKMDGRALTDAAYDARSGSVVITLRPGFTKTLSVGEHVLTAVFDDGAAEAPFGVRAPHVDPVNPDNPVGPGPIIPQTGDDSMPKMPMVCVGLLGASALLAALFARKSWRYAGARED